MFTIFAGMGAWPGPTTNALLHNATKLSLSKENLMLETCNAIIKAAINWARRAEQEPGVVDSIVNVHAIGGNLNIPKLEESELPATIAELEAMQKTRVGAMLETGAVRFSAWNTVMKVGKNCRSVWATVTTVSFESEFEASKATVEIASPADEGDKV